MLINDDVLNEFKKKGLHDKMLTMNGHIHDIDVMMKSIEGYASEQNLLMCSELDLRKMLHAMQALCSHVHNLAILKEAQVVIAECKIALEEFERYMRNSERGNKDA